MTSAPPVAPDPPEIAPEKQRSLWSRAGPWLLAYAALRLILGQISLPANLNPLLVNVGFLTVSLSVILLASATLYQSARNRLRPMELILLLLWGGTFFTLSRNAPQLWQVNHGSERPPAWLVHLITTAGDIGVIGLGAAIGIGVATLIRDRNILLPAGVFAAFADYFMVRFGTVHVAMQSDKGMKVVQAMSASVPSVHRSLSPTTMGMADFVFLAFFFACAWRFRMNPRGTFWVLVLLLSALLFSIRWLGAFPAVAPMALGFVLVNLRYFKLSRAEIHATAIVFVLMSCLLAAFFALR